MKDIPSFWVDSAARIDVGANKVRAITCRLHVLPCCICCLLFPPLLASFPARTQHLAPPARHCDNSCPPHLPCPRSPTSWPTGSWWRRRTGCPRGPSPSASPRGRPPPPHPPTHPPTTCSKWCLCALTNALPLLWQLQQSALLEPHDSAVPSSSRFSVPLTPTDPLFFPPRLPPVEDVLDRVFRIKDPSFAGIAPRKTGVTKVAHEEE